MKKKFELLDIPINWIHPSEDNPRKTKDEDELQQLIESIRENGLLEEISINRVGQNLFEIIDGERRFDAIKALEWDFCLAVYHQKKLCNFTLLMCQA